MTGNGDRALVDGAEELNRVLGAIAADLLDVSVDLVMLRAQAGPRGDGRTNSALATTHNAQDEVQKAQRVLLALLEGVRVRAEET
jgi:hypothetical protein